MREALVSRIAALKSFLWVWWQGRIGPVWPKETFTS